MTLDVMAYAPALSSSPALCSTQVELHISCKDLSKSDVLSKSDPLIAVYICDRAGSWSEVSSK